VITATADKNVITATEDRVYEVVTRKKNWEQLQTGFKSSQSFRISKIRWSK
jgi:hypothetical protein